MPYIAEESYRIFTIVDTASPRPERIYGMVDTHQSFGTFDEAHNWIEENGDRQIQYTIVQIFAKK